MGFLHQDLEGSEPLGYLRGEERGWLGMGVKILTLVAMRPLMAPLSEGSHDQRTANQGIYCPTAVLFIYVVH